LPQTCSGLARRPESAKFPETWTPSFVFYT
jgi:hypothetical protein